MDEGGLEQLAADCRVGHYPRLAILGGLGADSQQTVGWIDIVGLEQAHFLPPEGGIIRQADHAAITDRLLFGYSQEGMPLLVIGNPGQSPETWQEPPIALATEGLPWCVAASAYWVDLPQAPLHQVVKKTAVQQSTVDAGSRWIDRSPGSRP